MFAVLNVFAITGALSDARIDANDASVVVEAYTRFLFNGDNIAKDELSKLNAIPCESCAFPGVIVFRCCGGGVGTGIDAGDKDMSRAGNGEFSVVLWVEETVKLSGPLGRRPNEQLLLPALSPLIRDIKFNLFEKIEGGGD